MTATDRHLIEQASAPIVAEKYRNGIEVEVLTDQMQALARRVAELRARDRELDRQLVDVVSKINEGRKIRAAMAGRCGRG